MMGFPTWTLWGMGVSGLGALLAILLAYAAQSPRFLARAGVSGRQMELRLRTFIGLALACQLLTVGFFFAGVPLDPTAALVVATPSPQPTQTPETAGDIVALSPADITATAVSAVSPTPTSTRPVAATPATGAFGGPPAAITPTVPAIGTPITVAATATATPSATATPGSTATAAASSTPTLTPSSTPTPPPTPTPTPTLTPTPIEGNTAVVRAGLGTVPVQRVPGGQNVARLNAGDVVILQPGRANFGGEQWREIRTTAGILGWVPESTLSFDEEN